jgi:hypothetical protein
LWSVKLQFGPVNELRCEIEKGNGKAEKEEKAWKLSGLYLIKKP